MENIDWAFVTACIIGDGSLTEINRHNGTVMLSINHCIKQKPWLEFKADKLNAIFGRKCKVTEKTTFDDRTQKSYEGCTYSTTNQLLKPLYALAYPNGKKHFSEELLKDLTAEHLAVLWADDGNLEPHDRIGRLNLYDPEPQCKVVANWIESICGAVGRYEDYEKNGIGRLRYPPSQMSKIVLAVRPYLHPSMFYKIDMQYKNNTRNSNAVSNPSIEYTVETLPLVSDKPHCWWAALAKEAGLPRYKEGGKENIRARLVGLLSNG